MQPKTVIKAIVAFILFIIIVAFLFAAFETVQAGQRGVVLKWGKVDRVLDEGFHIVNPISEDVKIMNVQIQKDETNAGAASKDLQTVSSTIALNYHIDPDRVDWLYQNIGKDYAQQIISPAIQESVKAGTALFTAEELISKRSEVKDAIKNDLAERLDSFSILVDDFSIVNFDFSSEFNRAIEAKQVAEQNALKAKNDLDRIKIEAEQKIAAAQAEAEAIRIQAEAITQQGGRDYVQLQAIERWNGQLPAQMIPGATVPFIDLTK